MIWINRSFKQAIKKGELRPNDTLYEGRIHNDGRPASALHQSHENELLYKQGVVNLLGNYWLPLHS